jgi:hypothetical protein
MPWIIQRQKVEYNDVIVGKVGDLIELVPREAIDSHLRRAVLITGRFDQSYFLKPVLSHALLVLPSLRARCVLLV